MTKEKKSETTIMPIGSTHLIRVSDSFAITSKLLYGDIESLFNEAFYLLNNKYLNSDRENYLLNFENDPDYERKNKFKFISLSEEDLRKAKDLLSKIIVKNSEHTFSYYLRGIANRNLRLPKESIDDYSRSIELAPYFINSYHRRGKVKVLFKDYDGAIEDYSRVIEICPHEASAYFEIGELKFGIAAYKFEKELLKYFSEAIRDYSKAIELDSSYFEAYLRRGDAKIFMCNFSGAVEDITKAIQINPDRYIAYYRRGVAKYGLNDYSGSLNDFSKSLELSPNSANAYEYRARIKSKLQDFIGALEDYSKAIEFTRSPYYKNSWYLQSMRIQALLKDHIGTPTLPGFLT